MVRIPFLTVHFLLCHTFLNLHKNIISSLVNRSDYKTHVNLSILIFKKQTDAVKILLNASPKETWRFVTDLNHLLESYKDIFIS